jgi:hypothetical protein
MNKFGCVDYDKHIADVDDESVAEDWLTVTQLEQQYGLDFSDVARDRQD